MSKWAVLYRKEIVELQRNFKLIWVPLVFVLLGVMQPLTTYYMPQILDKAGGLPEGAVIEIPMPSADFVVAELLSQFNMIGILVLVLSFMAVISGERQSGASVLVLVKPVPRAAYVTSKWAAAATLTLIAFTLGYAAGWYYTDMLIGSVDFAAAISGWALYYVWLLFVITMTICFGTLLRSSGANAFVTLFSAVALSLLTGLLVEWMRWSPSRIINFAGAAITKGDLTGLWLPLTVTVAAIVALLILAVYAISRHDDRD